MDRLKTRRRSWVLGFAFAVGPWMVSAQTLDECVQLALKNNLELQQQQLNPMLAERDLAEQKSRNYGKLGVVGSYTHYNLPRTLAPLTPASISSDPAAVPTTEDLFNASIVYELPLFTGFAQTRSIEISKLRKEMARAAVALSREQLVYNVKTLYVNLLSLQAQMEAQAVYVEALQRLHDDISREMEQGKKARIDQLKAAADLKNAQARQVQLETDFSILKDSLAQLMNVDRVGELHGIEVAPEPLIQAPYAQEGLQRLRAARLATEKSRKAVGQSQAARYPQLYLNAAYGQNFGPNDAGNKYSGDWNNEEVWQAGVVLKWDIFNFGNTKSKVQKARIAERQSRYEQERVEQELTRALREAAARINAAVDDFQSTREELALTTETERIEQIRYQQGQADTADLLQAKARTQQARSRSIAAGYRWKTAQYHLDYLLEKGATK